MHIHPQASEVASPFCVCLCLSCVPTHSVEGIILKVNKALKPPVLLFSPVSSYNGCLFYRVTDYSSVVAYKACVRRDLP